MTVEASKKLESESTKLAVVAAKDGTVSLADSLKGQKHCHVDQVFETLPFSFLSSGMTPFGGNSGGLGTIIRAGNGDPVKDVTSDFMKKVFQLRPGETTAVMDSQGRTAYVVRLIADISPEDLRRENFAVGSQMGLDRQLFQLSMQNRQVTLNEWIIQFLEDLEVEWKPESRNLLR
jgi:hypothetical protein